MEDFLEMNVSWFPRESQTEGPIARILDGNHWNNGRRQPEHGAPAVVNRIRSWRAPIWTHGRN
jgi:hypothetical protein